MARDDKNTWIVEDVSQLALYPGAGDTTLDIAISSIKCWLGPSSGLKALEASQHVIGLHHFLKRKRHVDKI